MGCTSGLPLNPRMISEHPTQRAPHAAPAVTFLPPTNLVKPDAGGMVATDLDGDGKSDIAVLGTVMLARRPKGRLVEEETQEISK